MYNLDELLCNNQHALLISTETQEEFNELMKMLENRGFMWYTGQNPTDIPFTWLKYRSKTVVNINSKLKSIFYDSLNSYAIESRRYGYKRFRFSDIDSDLTEYI